MREPYASFFAGYEAHWLLGQYLCGEVPLWGLIASDKRLDALSTGEKILLDFAAAWSNVFDAAYVDEATRTRIICGVVESAYR